VASNPLVRIIPDETNPPAHKKEVCGYDLAQKVLVFGFLCATSVSSVVWFYSNSSTTETQRTQRLHREECDRDFLCTACADKDATGYLGPELMETKSDSIAI
jgi:hypothetical protein